VRTCHFASIGILSLSATYAFAATGNELAGKWSGQFNGVQIEIPLESGPIGWLAEPKTATQGPRFVQTTLQIEFETQKNGLAVGTWISGNFKQKFVCAQLSSAIWNCLDAGGRASLEVQSEAAIKVCYLDNREGGRGAGCAVLHKAP
jgi:hypothetical protein